MLVNHISRIHKYQEPRKQKPKHIRQNLTESQVVRAFQRITRWILILQNESWNKKITQVYAISFDRIYSNSKTVSMKRLNFLVIKKIALAENGTFNCHNWSFQTILICSFPDGLTDCGDSNCCSKPACRENIMSVFLSSMLSF